MGLHSPEIAYLFGRVRALHVATFAAAVLFLTFSAYGGISAQSAKTYTQNQRCAAVASTGGDTYDATIDCTFQIARPDGDSGSDPILVGIFIPESIPGFVSATIPGYTCATDGSREGIKRTTCTGTQQPGSTVNATVRMRVTGGCGTQTAMGTQVNVNSVLSEFVNTGIALPACGGVASSSSSSSMSSSSRSRVSVTRSSAQASFASAPYLQGQVAASEDADARYMAAANANFTGSVTMQKSADRGEASPGDRVWFTITVRNNSNRVLRGLNLTDRFLAGDFTVIDANGGTVAGGFVEWLNGSLQPYETKEIRYQVRIGDSLSHGYVVKNNATLTGGELSSPLSASTQIGIMRAMPPTGFVKLKPLY